MKASFIKRASAYLIDMMLLGMIIMLISFFLPESRNMTALNSEMNEINELALKNEISVENYINRFADITHDLDRERVLYSIVNAFFIIGYFVIFPYLNGGQTFGKYLLGIKTRRLDQESLTLNDLLIRNFIINGLGYMLLSLAILYTVPSTYYFIIVSILGIAQFLLVLISIFMVLYRKDRAGLQDMLSQTEVVICQK